MNKEKIEDMLGKALEALDCVREGSEEEIAYCKGCIDILEKILGML